MTSSTKCVTEVLSKVLSKLKRNRIMNGRNDEGKLEYQSYENAESMGMQSKSDSYGKMEEKGGTNEDITFFHVTDEDWMRYPSIIPRRKLRVDPKQQESDESTKNRKTTSKDGSETTDWLKENQIPDNYRPQELGRFTIGKKTRSKDGSETQDWYRVRVKVLEDSSRSKPNPDQHSSKSEPKPDLFVYDYKKIQDGHSGTPTFSKSSKPYTLSELEEISKDVNSFNHHLYDFIDNPSNKFFNLI